VRSLRDLTAQHLPLLRNIRDKASAVSHCALWDLTLQCLAKQRCGRVAYSRKGTSSAVLTRHSLRQPGKCKERIPLLICERSELSWK